MPLLEVTDLVKLYPLKSPGLRFNTTVKSVRAVDHVSLDLNAGETLGIVGESGCGKSTLGKCILRLTDPTSGEIRFDGRNLLDLNAEAMRRERRNIQIVFQDPFASLDPRMRIGDILREPLAVHQIVGRDSMDTEVRRLLDLVGLPHAALQKYPHQFSGGQRQRVGIARALAVRPKLIVADEPISALDVSIRAQILNLFKDIQAKYQLGLIFIAHDLGAVRQVSDRIAVMYLGTFVETGDSETTYTNPRHPYTRALLRSIPSVLNSSPSHAAMDGDVPSPVDLPSGCRFQTRCPFVQDICKTTVPPLVPVEGLTSCQQSACHFAATLPNFDLV